MVGLNDPNIRFLPFEQLVEWMTDHYSEDSLHPVPWQTKVLQLLSRWSAGDTQIVEKLRDESPSPVLGYTQRLVYYNTQVYRAIVLYNTIRWKGLPYAVSYTHLTLPTKRIV